MFTGIVQDVGRILAVDAGPAHTRMRFATHLDTRRWHLGDSVAVDGCCLTVTELPANGEFAAVLSAETLHCTHFAEARVGQAVNLEPALHLGDALGGHLVTGHIDGVGSIASMQCSGDEADMTVSLPRELCRYVVVKGSVAVNGVSLTVNEADDERFTVHLIPHTLAHTNLGRLTAGGRVNIETDLIGRYVERLLKGRSHPCEENHEPGQL